MKGGIQCFKNKILRNNGISQSIVSNVVDDIEDLKRVVISYEMYDPLLNDLR